MNIEKQQQSQESYIQKTVRKQQCSQATSAFFLPNQYPCSLLSQAHLRYLFRKNTKLWRNLWKWRCLLSLEGKQIGLYGILCLDYLQQTPYLTHINFTRNSIGNEGVRLLAMRQWKILEQLILSQNMISSRGIEYLLSGEWKNLNTLVLDGNPLGLTSIRMLSKHKISKKLKFLSLQSCSLANEFINFLLLMPYPNLTHINIRNNKISYNSALRLCQHAQLFPRLVEIQINFCRQDYLIEKEKYNGSVNLKKEGQINKFIQQQVNKIMEKSRRVLQD